MTRWGTKRLGEVCENLDSKRKPITKTHRIKGSIPYYGATGIVDYVNDHIFNEKLVLLGEDGAKWNAGEECAFIIDGRTWVNNHAHVLRPNRKIVLDEWLVYILNYEDLTPYISGMTVPKLNQGKMNEIEIPLPSLSEQRNIISILNESLTAIDQAKLNTENNLQSTREIFASVLQNIFANPGVDWEVKELQDIVHPRCKLSYGIVQPGNYFPNGLPVVRPTDLTNKFIHLAPLKRINPQLAESYKRTTLMGNELLLCVRGNTGIISIASDELKGANVTRGIVPICFNEKLLCLQFGYYLFISDHIQKQIKEKTYGAALMQINIGDLRKISTLVPPLLEQDAIFQKLETLSMETKKLESIYEQKLKNLEELKKSILRKAFAGELNLSTEKITA